MSWIAHRKCISQRTKPPRPGKPAIELILPNSVEAAKTFAEKWIVSNDTSFKRLVDFRTMETSYLTMDPGMLNDATFAKDGKQG